MRRQLLALRAVSLLAALALASTPAVLRLEQLLAMSVLPAHAEALAAVRAAGAWNAGLASALAVGMSVLAAIAARHLDGRRLVAVSLAAGCVLLAAPLLLLQTTSIWLSGSAALFVVALSPLAWTGREEGRGADAAAPSDAGRNDRLLAVAYRAEGRLDLALEHLRRCAVDPQVLDEMVQLGLEFERRRQFARAHEIFDFLARRDARYKDLAQRPGLRAPAPSPGRRVPAGAGPAHAGMPRMLGRCEVLEELGRGAMATVYTGRDTVTARTVAIKTMRLSSEFEADELEAVKRRFFGEAESAGRLEHPNIVRILAAGEEQGLAYIVMELLAGHDLTFHTRSGALLPLATVLGIAARVADALDYAHTRHVVHRDIKPGNIMYDAVTDTLKVTDFGIARITDSNKTRTGMVLGTPSFMSPEQLAGRKIDGQSDLYSLGVTLYQLLCGALPFEGASLAQLMYRISNEAPRDPRTFNPALPDDLVQVIDKALAKDKVQRFATGADMAAALRSCARNLTALDMAL